MTAHHLELDDRLRSDFYTLARRGEARLGRACRGEARQGKARYGAGSRLDPAYLDYNDCLWFNLTREKVRVVEIEPGTGAITLRWPSGDRIAYSTSDGIWQHFIRQY